MSSSYFRYMLCNKQTKNDVAQTSAYKCHGLVMLWRKDQVKMLFEGGRSAYTVTKKLDKASIPISVGATAGALMMSACYHCILITHPTISLDIYWSDRKQMKPGTVYHYTLSHVKWIINYTMAITYHNISQNRCNPLKCRTASMYLMLQLRPCLRHIEQYQYLNGNNLAY